MTEHRQNTFRINLSLVKTTMDDNGEYSFDFSEFDQFAQVFWDTSHMDAMETGFVAQHVPGGWSSPDIKVVNTPQTVNKQKRSTR